MADQIGQFQKDITELPNLSSYNMENIFRVYTNSDGKYFYNILRKINFGDSVDNRYFFTYYVESDYLAWTNISFKFYKTIQLWWLICIFNKIKNPTSFPKSGTELKIPTREAVQLILSDIQKSQT